MFLCLSLCFAIQLYFIYVSTLVERLLKAVVLICVIESVKIMRFLIRMISLSLLAISIAFFFYFGCYFVIVTNKVGFNGLIVANLNLIGKKDQFRMIHCTLKFC